MLHAILGGPTWLDLDGDMVRVAEFTLGGLIELGAWCAARRPDPFDLPPHDDPALWWMAVVRRAKSWPPDTTALSCPPGIEPAEWWATGLSLTTNHPEPDRLGRWLASPGGLEASVRLRGVWAGQSPYSLGLAMLDRIEGVEYHRLPPADWRKAAKAVMERCHCTPAEIRAMTLAEFWGAASGFAAARPRAPINQDPAEVMKRRAELKRQAEEWLAGLEAGEGQE